MGSDDLAFAGVVRLAELVRGGDVSARELTELYLGRIERFEPELNAFRTVMAERALVDADQADARRGAGDERPLLGVPIAVKDTEDVAGEVTALGTAAVTEPARADGELVRRLRAAGAVIVGKTNLPELAIMGTTEGPAFGVTRNPWDTDRTPGGSSGGSAAAVAAGLVAAASASDGVGSIRIPAGACGLVGLKPQRDRISLAPRGEHWHGLTVLGFNTRTVADTALLLDIAAGRTTEVASRRGRRASAAPAADSSPDPSSAPSSSPEASSTSRASSASAFARASSSGPALGASFAAAAARPPGPLRVALSARPVFPARVDPQVRRVLEAMGEVLRSLGHAVEWRDPAYGLAANAITPRYLRGIADDAASVTRPERLQRRTRGFARLGSLIPDRLLQAARRGEAAHAERINRIFEQADVLVVPVAATPPVKADQWEGLSATRTLLGMSAAYPYAAVWSMTGQPACAVPTPGLSDHGLPIGVQLVAAPDGEAVLLSLAAQLEAEIGWPERRPPVS